MAFMSLRFCAAPFTLDKAAVWAVTRFAISASKVEINKGGLGNQELPVIDFAIKEALLIKFPTLVSFFIFSTAMTLLITTFGIMAIVNNTIPNTNPHAAQAFFNFIIAFIFLVFLIVNNLINCTVAMASISQIVF